MIGEVLVPIFTGAISAHFDDDDFYSPEYLDFMLEGLEIYQDWPNC